MDGVPGAAAQVRTGMTVLAAPDPALVSGADRKAAIAKFQAEAKAALSAVGYPERADPAAINEPMVVLILFILVFYGTMVYGPIAALLVELFPARIRYSAMSLPYHIGNGWFGGFLPTTAFAMVAATGNIYYGLWYPIVVGRHYGRTGIAVSARKRSGKKSMSKHAEASPMADRRRRHLLGVTFPSQ